MPSANSACATSNKSHGNTWRPERWRPAGTRSPALDAVGITGATDAGRCLEQAGERPGEDADGGATRKTTDERREGEARRGIALPSMSPVPSSMWRA